jgi:hypothetical protein
MRRIVCVLLTTALLLGAYKAYSKPVIAAYDLQFNFDFTMQKLYCNAALTFNNTTQNDTLHLLLYRLLKVTSISDESGQGLNYTQTVTSFSDWEALQINHITILPGKYKTGKPIQKIHIAYEGLLLGYTETGMEYVKDNIDSAFTILRPDCFAYPLQGIPNWENNQAAGQPFFDYTLSVTVPENLSVVNAGQLLSVTRKNSSTVYVYRNLKPAWRIDIAIGKYASINNNGITIHYLQEDSVGAKMVSNSVKKTLDIYSSWFGKIPVSGYSIIEIPEGWGSQTDVSCIIQTAAAFKNSDNLYQLYHEISHLWNIASKDAAPCRLESEGLAMLLQYLCMEKLNNKPGSLDSATAVIFMKLKQRISTDTAAANTAMIYFGKMKMTDLSYSKGMIFFYLLYKTIGEDSFMKTIKGYYNLYRNSGASTIDFTTYLVKECHSKKVETLVNEWVLSNQSSQRIMDSMTIEDILK